MAKKSLIIKSKREPKFSASEGQIPGVTKSSW